MENKEEASRVAATASLEAFLCEREGVMAAAPCSSSAPLLQPPVSHQPGAASAAQRACRAPGFITEESMRMFFFNNWKCPNKMSQMTLFLIIIYDFCLQFLYPSSDFLIPAVM
jgi:hypothetical protein